MLGRLVEQALASNNRVEAAQASVRQAQALRDVAAAARLPSLGGTGSVSHSDVASLGDMQVQVAAEVGLSYIALRAAEARRDIELKQKPIERKDRDIGIPRREDREDHLRADAPKALEVRRRERGDEGRAAPHVPGHDPRGRSRPRSTTRRTASCAAQGDCQAEGSSTSSAPTSAARPSAPRRASS
jgi:hypothetical protein